MEWFTALIVIVLNYHITSSSSSQAVHPASDALLKLQDKCLLGINVQVLRCTRPPDVALTLDLYYHDHPDEHHTVGQCLETGNCTCRNPTNCTVNSNDTFMELRLTGEQNQPEKLVCNPLQRGPITVNCTSDDSLLNLKDKCLLGINVQVLRCTRPPDVALTLDLYYHDNPYEHRIVGQCPETGNCTCRNPTNCTVNSNDTFVELRLTGEQNQPEKLVCNPLQRGPITVNCTSDEEQEVKQFSYIIIIGVIVPSIGVICCVVCWRYKSKNPEHVKDDNSQEAEPERQSLKQDIKGEDDDDESISQTAFKEDRDLRKNAMDSTNDMQASAVPETPGDVLELVQSNVQRLEIAQTADGERFPLEEIAASDTEPNQPSSIAEVMTAQSGAEQNAIKLPFCETGCGIHRGIIESNGAVIFRVRELPTDSDYSLETDAPLRHARRGGCRKYEKTKRL